jgi:hypothetical protein
VDWFAKYVLSEPEGYPMGKPLTSGDWELTVTKASAKSGGNKEKRASKEVTVEFSVRHLGSEESDFSLDLTHDVYLKTDDNRSLSVYGFLSRLGGSDTLLKSSSLTFTKEKEYPIRLVFRVPAGMNKSKFKLKEFPYVAIRF